VLFSCDGQVIHLRTSPVVSCIVRCADLLSCYSACIASADRWYEVSGASCQLSAAVAVLVPGCSSARPLSLCCMVAQAVSFLLRPDVLIRQAIQSEHLTGLRL
jgi:hypothetical protein